MDFLAHYFKCLSPEAIVQDKPFAEKSNILQFTSSAALCLGKAFARGTLL